MPGVEPSSSHGTRYGRGDVAVPTLLGVLPGEMMPAAWFPQAAPQQQQRGRTAPSVQEGPFIMAVKFMMPLHSSPTGISCNLFLGCAAAIYRCIPTAHQLLLGPPRSPEQPRQRDALLILLSGQSHGEALASLQSSP